MFKKVGKNVNDNTLADKVNQDLIVHNMPSHSRLGSAMPSKTENRNQFLSPKPGPASNVKTVGGLIIVVGIIFVLVLIYFSYRFLIKPQAIPPTPTTSSPSTTNNQSVETESEQQPQVATSTIVETITPGSMFLDESMEEDLINGADSENFLLPEEGTIIDEFVWTPIIDTDGDGLTDEEEFSLGTNLNEIDTDQDGFLDLAELKSSYNPSGTGKIELNESLTRFQNENLRYSFLYPKSWTLRDNNTDYLTIITSPDNSILQVVVTENNSKENIIDWYKKTVSNEDSSLEIIKIDVLGEGLFDEENLHFYFTDNNKEFIYILSYIPAIPQRLAFMNIFQMVATTFKLQ